MSTEHDTFDELHLAATLDGTATPEEQAGAERFYEGDPALPERLSRIEPGWRRGLAAKPEYDRAALQRRVLAAIGETERAPVIERGVIPERFAHRLSRPASSRWQGLLAMMSAVLLILGAGIFRFQSSPRHFERPQTYRTASGERTKVTLVDGTTAVLAPQSTLEVPAGFGGRVRTVTLVGEAYFDVTHASKLPFAVTTGTVTARVLGTTFGVRRYTADSSTRVAVTSGKVVMSTNRASVAATLCAGDVAEASDSGSIIRPDGNAASFLGWTASKLVLRNASAPEILTTLSRWYGYRFQLADSSLANVRVNIRVSTDSLQEALSTLKLVLDADLTFRGDTIVVRSRRDVPEPPKNQYRYRHMIPPTSEFGR